MGNGRAAAQNFVVLGLSAFVGLGSPSVAASSESVPKGQKTFATPQEAVQELIKDCLKDDSKALLKLFGPGSKNIVESGDRRQDKDGRSQFGDLAGQKNALIPDPMTPDKIILSIGPNDWPFPVPLVRSGGQWYFDTADGAQEILARRIGTNETNAIEICRGYVEAQYEYAQDHRQDGVPVYAQHIVSSPGKQDGLYWEPGPGLPAGNVPKGFAKAAASMQNSEREPYHGYFFKVLKAQGANARGGKLDYVVKDAMIGGFGLVAWPAEYGASGVQTFIVCHDGTVYEKNIGPDTAKAAEQITEFDPDKSWHPVEPEGEPPAAPNP